MLHKLLLQMHALPAVITKHNKLNWSIAQTCVWHEGHYCIARSGETTVCQSLSVFSNYTDWF